MALSGIGVSRGIAIGKAHILQHGNIDVTESELPANLVEQEVNRFRQAVHTARQQLQSIRERIPEDTREDIAAFIDTHLLMLDDNTLAAAPIDLIRARHCNAEWALKLRRDAIVEVFDKMNDAYLRTRRDDIDHVINRIQRVLLNDAAEPGRADTDHLHGAIVLAGDLTPADTVLLQHEGIVAFVTEYGGPLSHTAILARSLRIPAIVGMHNVTRYVHDGEQVILDGQAGILIASADENLLKHYRNRQYDEKQWRIELDKLKHVPAVTIDNKPIQLMCNVELPVDIEAANREATEGVGLYRTEFLFMNRSDTPDEEEQYKCYLDVLNRLQGRPLTIRTLDLGADKEVDGGHPGDRLCTNPALGLRAIRLCLRDKDLFRPQLRAILRTSAHGPVRMMIPMLSNSQELLQVISLVNEIKQELRQEGHGFNPDMPVGGMIEVPAAALSATFFARHLDFMSIGTNDLIQYTLAIDRIDDEVNYLYDPLHPAVLRLIQMVIMAGESAGIPVTMCGEMAGDPRYTRLLLGMGLTEFSMHPASLQEVKQVVKSSSLQELAPLVRRLLETQEPEEISSLLDTINADIDLPAQG